MKKLVLMLMLFAPTAMFAQKFGHVDTQAIMQSLPEISKINGELEAKAKQFENELQEMQKELQRKADEYDKTKSTMNASKQQETEQSLMELNQKIQDTYTANSQQLQQLQQELLTPIQSKVAKAIENVGNNGKYTIILMKNSLPFISSTLVTDVTSECKTEVLKLK